MYRSFTTALSLFVAVLALSLTGCTEDECTAIRTVQTWEPVYIQPEDFRAPIQVDVPRELKQPGKIYVYGDILFINEIREGIHVVDNSDPRSPVMLAFIPIPNNVDMAVKDGILYADHYVDMVAMDITDPRAPVFAGRSTDVFPHQYYLDQELGFLVDYEAKEVDMEVPCDQGEPYYLYHDVLWFGGVAEMDLAASFSNGAAAPQAAAGSGVGGSMARFTIAGEHLYTVDEYTLRVFDLSQPAQPQLATTVNIGWGIETIFPYGEQLFIGSQTGMFIYDRSNPLEPVQMSVFEHARACDPVFVDGNLAYVTLRDGTTCQNFTNQLDVVDISDLYNPELLITYPMHRPHGLSVTNNTLFLCEDDLGLKVFDASDWREIGNRLLTHEDDFYAYDVIALNHLKLAIVVGQDGLYQFDFTDPAQLERLSVIPLGR